MINIVSHLRRLGQLFFIGSLILSFFGGLSGCSAGNYSQKIGELRAVWVQAESITTPEKVDQMLARVEAGHLNAIFVNVFVYGYAYYESNLLEKQSELAPDYDPLAYIIEQAHRRNIEVHAWLVAGPVGGVNGPILSQHPDWAMVSLDGEIANWLNYSRPDVRQFIADIALELVQNYEVDGIHFDYTRYPHPGAKWGFDPYSADTFAKEYNIDLETLRYADLPAYGEFYGNSLAEVSTAQVLATFDNGRPAVLLNSYGAGEVIILNWDVNKRQVAANSEILRRSINYLLQKKGDVYILESKTNIQKYSWGDFRRTSTWLEDIGWPATKVTEGKIAALNKNAVLVVPNVYLMKDRVASNLADFVKRGGGVIFIDGPTLSINNKNLQAITGMRTSGHHFREVGLLVANGNHEIIPNSSREVVLEAYQTLDEEWKTFRKQGISKLLQDVYQRVKQETPHVLVTITITANQEYLANQVFLDWEAWLEGAYVDLIIPRAYVNQDEALEPIIATWQPVITASKRIMLGLRVYAYRGSKEVKSPSRILKEIDLVQASRSRGVILFDLEGISDDSLKALATGSFSSPSGTSD